MPITTIELEERTRGVTVELRVRGPYKENEGDIDLRVRTPEIEVRN